MSESSRIRPLSWFAALVLALLGSLQACDCGSTGVDTRRFACTQDDECASGFVCRQGECQPEGEDQEEEGAAGKGGVSEEVHSLRCGRAGDLKKAQRGPQN